MVVSLFYVTAIALNHSEVGDSQSLRRIGFEGFFSSFAISISKNEDQKTD
jgi:hypothetical protein